MIVLANGCFDILHYGHIQHLREAKKLGRYLMVALTLDDYVNKGPDRPINPWIERAETLLELRCVDTVIPSRGAVSILEAIRPAVFVKGIDYKGGKFSEPVVEVCQRLGIRIEYTNTPKRSTTELIRKICA